MNTRRNWTKVTVFVVLALTSLSSIAMSAPHRDQLSVYAAPVAPIECSESDVDRFKQYLAAVEWTEQGRTAAPIALSISCEENSVNRFEQYLDAIASVEEAVNAAPVRTNEGNLERFEQYQAAIEPSFDAPKHDGNRFEQYMTATGAAGQ